MIPCYACFLWDWHWSLHMLSWFEDVWHHGGWESLQRSVMSLPVETLFPLSPLQTYYCLSGFGVFFLPLCVHVWVQTGDKRQIRSSPCCRRRRQTSECVFALLVILKNNFVLNLSPPLGHKEGRVYLTKREEFMGLLLERKQVDEQPGSPVLILNRLQLSPQIPPVQVTYSTVTFSHIKERADCSGGERRKSLGGAWNLKHTPIER